VSTGASHPASITELRGIDSHKVTIVSLPDDALLEIFSFYVNDAQEEGWHTLVHVCQKWRCVVFASPLRLRLRLLCTNRRPVMGMLGVWPPFPLVVLERDDPTSPVEGADNIVAALECNDRVCEVILSGVPNSLWERVAAVTQKPCPALTYLELRSNDQPAPALPDSFLDRSAPSLQSLHLDGIPFPAAAKLLLSSNHLVDLNLSHIPNSGYIPPEAMVACLSTLPKLASLHLGFLSPRPLPNTTTQHPPPPPPTRTILLALTSLKFKGISEYLECIMAQIDAPLLDFVDILFFNQLIFTPFHLSRFIGHTGKLKALNRSNVLFFSDSVQVTLFYRYTGSIPRTVDYGPRLKLGISCEGLDWQLSSLAQVCGPTLSSLSTVKRLDIMGHYPRPGWGDDIDSIQWLEFLHPFTAVENLYLSKEVALRVGPALQELGSDGAMEVLPALQNLYFAGLRPSGLVHEALGQFGAMRQLSGHPLTVGHWEMW
jgi:hypothetical protein